MFIVILLIIIFVIGVVLHYNIFSYLRKNYKQNQQSREILELIKQNNPIKEEPIFHHDIIPDFSGYLE